MVTWLLLVITCYYWPANPFRALPMKAKAFNYDFFERFSEICCSDHKKSSCPKPRDLQKKYRLTYRRKFRSQTSDNMERWKSRGGQSQRREDQRRERVRRKKMQAREKGRKAAIHCVFPMICGSAGSKSRLAEPSGQMRDEQLHAVVVRSTFRSQKC